MDKKLTVAHVISDAGIGGAQVYVLQLLQRMKTDFRLIVICPKEGHYVSKYKDEAAEVVTLNFQMPHLRLLRQLRQIVQQKQVDVVHAHLMKACVFSAFAVVGLKVKVFCSLHGDLLPQTFSPFAFQLYRSLNGIAAFTKTHYLCISEWEKQALKKQGIPLPKMTVVYNAIELQKFDYHKVYFNEVEVFRVVFIGRLHHQKGILTLLRVAKRLPTIHFDIVGEGELEPTLIQAMTKLKNIQWHQFQEDIRSFLRAAHCFFLPSNWEGFGIAIIEAMAIGRPIVSSRVGGIPELVDEGEGGFLCLPKDVDGFVAAIKKLKQKTELVEQFGQYNRQKVEKNFSLSKLTAQLSDIYLR